MVPSVPRYSSFLEQSESYRTRSIFVVFRDCWVLFIKILLCRCQKSVEIKLNNTFANDGVRPIRSVPV